MNSQHDVPLGAGAASAHRRYQSDPSAPPPTLTNLTISEAIDLWEHANLLFATYEWTEAEILYRRILRRTDSLVLPNRACLWASLGLIYYHGGEDWRAYGVLNKAVCMEPRNPMLHFLAGTAAFEIQFYGHAHLHFVAAHQEFLHFNTEHWCCRSRGLDFLLTRSRVFHNQQSAFYRYNHQQMGTAIPGEEYAWGTTQRLPAGLIFQPRPIPEVEFDAPTGQPRTAVQPAGYS